MTRRLLILFLLLFSLALGGFSQNVNYDNSLRELILKYRQAEVTVSYSDIKSIDVLTRNVSILSVKDKTVYISISPRTIEWFLSQKIDYHIIERPDTKGIISATSVSQAMEWDTYPTYSQYVSIMQSFQTLYPSLCHLDTIGTSIDGRLVLALKISDNASTDEDEPEVFYSSSMHGDETGGFILMLRLADYLLKNYDLNSRAKNIVDNLEVWINPLANPDGAYWNGNVISSLSLRENANGYDLNRNFPPSINPQKETLDMVQFMRKHKFVISANFHAGEEVVNYPWDRWSKLHADNDWFYNISRNYADTVHNHSVTGYMTYLDNGVTNGYQWYYVYGGRQDFITYELQGREVTIELDGNYYVTPAANLNSLWQYNWRSLLGYLENALYGIHGIVLDANTALPVSAKVFISGHDKDSSHVYSNVQTGSFTRLLSPGSWDLTLSASGYYDAAVYNVNVVSGQKTDLVVNMIPILNSIDTTNPEVPILYPNPAAIELRAVLPESLMGTVNVRIISMSGRLMSEYNTLAEKGIPVLIDLESFPAAYIQYSSQIVLRKSHSIAGSLS